LLKRSKKPFYHAVGAYRRRGGGKVCRVRQADHPDARHHCVAWVAGPPDDSQQLGFSDDGEPAGTAGKPMLAQLMGSGVGEITAVVVRYYGGILLGTGGLVKAYGGGVHQALAQLTTQRKTPLTAYTLQCEYGQLAGVETLLAQFSGKLSKANIWRRFSCAWRFPG
jgi:uncharacterized YigZ family protein